MFDFIWQLPAELVLLMLNVLAIFSTIAVVKVGASLPWPYPYITRIAVLVMNGLIVVFDCRYLYTWVEISILIGVIIFVVLAVFNLMLYIRLAQHRRAMEDQPVLILAIQMGSLIALGVQYGVLAEAIVIGLSADTTLFYIIAGGLALTQMIGSQYLTLPSYQSEVSSA